MYAFRKIYPLREAIQKKIVCKFYTDEQNLAFVPVSIETSPVYGHNYIVGIDSDNNPKAIRLSETHKISVLEDSIKITKEMCELISDHLDEIYEEEYNECSD